MINEFPTVVESSRVVLEGVSPISYQEHDGKVELCPFPACLKTCLEYMGEQVAYSLPGQVTR